MRRSAILLVAALALGGLPVSASPEPVVSGPAAATDPADCQGPVVAHVSVAGVQLRNGCVVRWWDGGQRLRTTLIADQRSGTALLGPVADFSLRLNGVPITGDLPVTAVRAEHLPDGVRVIWTLLLPEVAEITRTVEMYRGIAGWRTGTAVRALAPLALSGYEPERVPAGSPVTTVHAMRAGADWRENNWSPQVSIGDAHTGTWRVSETADGPGAPLEAPGQWLSASLPNGANLGLVLERNNYASSRMGYGGGVASAIVDLSRDVVYTGPFEEDIHAENPGPGPARHQVVMPGRALSLEPVTVVLGRDADDEPWQFHRILTERRSVPYRRDVVFNTNNVDANLRSTGAKDDVDFDRFLPLAEAAREMGVDVFVFDDGWQARSGDWCADAATCTEPRWDGSATSKFRPRFPDERFDAVRQVLAGDPLTDTDDMRLGLWFTPMAFHPSSRAFQMNPQWSCAPVGTATGAASVADPNSGSFDAGIGLWNPLAWGVHPDTFTPVRAIDYVEDRIRRAIDIYGATYFKFDFLVWVDCGGAEPVTMYEYRDAFLGMLGRLQAAHPEVTFQIDETNDYRLFPFSSVARGPSWFQNSSPSVERLLHNLWNLAPYVPGFSLGQHAISRAQDRAARGIDFLMAAALTQHLTIWMRIDTDLTPTQRETVRAWTDFYRANAADLGTFMYPLLDDPAAGGWTGLQPWDRDARSGYVLLYRLGPAGPTPAVSLRGLGGVADGTSFALTAVDPAQGTETALGTRTAAELRAGVVLPVTAAGYSIVRVAQA